MACIVCSRPALCRGDMQRMHRNMSSVAVFASARQDGRCSLRRSWIRFVAAIWVQSVSFLFPPFMYYMLGHLVLSFVRGTDCSSGACFSTWGFIVCIFLFAHAVFIHPFPFSLFRFNAVCSGFFYFRFLFCLFRLLHVRFIICLFGFLLWHFIVSLFGFLCCFWVLDSL